MPLSTSARLALASGLTLGNAGCGFAGILALAVGGETAGPAASALIFGAWLFDTVDGMAARRLGVSGPFGAVLDSVCDLVSFGVLPALLVAIASGVSPLIGGLCGGAYLAGALLRLSRYTMKALSGAESGDRLWFEGLASPAAAMALAVTTLAAPTWAPLGAIVMPVLMVSKIQYPDLTKFYIQRRIPVWTLLVPLLALFALDWPLVLLLIFALYIVAGPFLRIRTA